MCFYIGKKEVEEERGLKKKSYTMCLLRQRIRAFLLPPYYVLLFAHHLYIILLLLLSFKSRARFQFKDGESESRSPLVLPSSYHGCLWKPNPRAALLPVSHYVDRIPQVYALTPLESAGDPQGIWSTVVWHRHSFFSWMWFVVGKGMWMASVDLSRSPACFEEDKKENINQSVRCCTNY